jgi:hypothetical protein
VFAHDAFVLHGHPVTGEFDHAAAACAVPCIKGKREGFGVSISSTESDRMCRSQSAFRTALHQSRCPLCHGNLRA